MFSASRLCSAEARIHPLAYRFRNADSEPVKGAAQNLANGCAAFWHRASGGNAVVGAFMPYLNRTQDVLRACEAYEADFGQPCRMRDEAFLDQLLPLNEMAVQSLKAAYEDTGWSRSTRELVARTDKAEAEATDALIALRTSGGSNIVPIDWSRVDRSIAALRDTDRADAAVSMEGAA